MIFQYRKKLANQTAQFYGFRSLQTSLSVAQDGGKWKPEVPYKNCVRIVSELFEVPSGADYGPLQTDIKLQFFEYMMNSKIDFSISEETCQPNGSILRFQVTTNKS